jgi:hypothetical protein
MPRTSQHNRGASTRRTSVSRHYGSRNGLVLSTRARIRSRQIRRVVIVQSDFELAPSERELDTLEVVLAET